MKNSDQITSLILSCTALLDDLGAREWNLRVVGVVSATVLLTIHHTIGKRKGIEVYALLHALISGLGSMMCVYLDIYASEELTGATEPLRSFQCKGPLTSLHRILPAITMGYSILDIMEGLMLRWDFLLHGIVTFGIMLYFCESKGPQIITPMLLMEISTINLNLVKAEFFSPLASLINQALFALTFFVFRLVVSPYLLLRIFQAIWQEQSSATYKECFPWHFGVVIHSVGMFYCLLNFYWFVKIVQKAHRKATGVEKLNANNNLNESEHHMVGVAKHLSNGHLANGGPVDASGRTLSKAKVT